jgi:hypothetical protein
MTRQWSPGESWTPTIGQAVVLRCTPQPPLTTVKALHWSGRYHLAGDIPRLAGWLHPWWFRPATPEEVASSQLGLGTLEGF